MHRLFLFNPENDIALARNIRQFTPPMQAAILHRAGAALPFWLGDADDLMLVPEEDLVKVTHWIDSIGFDGPRPVSSASGLEISSLEPWGWSLDACRQFRQAGVREDLIEPYENNVDDFRNYSHRRNTIKLIGLLAEKGFDVPDVSSIEATDIDQVRHFVTENGAAYIKAPWSSTGRGVFPVSRESFQASAERINGIIRRQGSVMVEPALDKVRDFAMLFHDGGRRFAGFSLFFNATTTSYGGNFVASDEAILSDLSGYILPSYAISLAVCLTELLPSLFQLYHGPVGVDMLVYRSTDGDYRIDPCVEINLRYTMGFVAQSVYAKAGRRGIMTVSPASSSDHQGTSTLHLAPAGAPFNFLFKATD